MCSTNFWISDYFFFIIISGVRLLVLRPLVAYCTSPRWWWWWWWWWWLWRNWWNKDWQGKPKYSEKTCPSATLSTTNPTWLDPGLNSGCRGGKPATNRLSYGAAFTFIKYKYKILITSVDSQTIMSAETYPAKWQWLDEQLTIESCLCSEHEHECRLFLGEWSNIHHHYKHLLKINNLSED
jgi:hypothetical protein